MSHLTFERKEVHRFYSGPKVEIVRHADPLFWNLAEDTKELLLYPYNSKIPIVFVARDYIDSAIAQISGDQNFFNETLIKYIAGDYPVAFDDVFIDVDTMSQNLILTLPGAPEINRRIVITNIGNSGHVVSIMGNGKIISGMPMQVLNGNYASMTLRYIGSSWRVTDFFPGNNGGVALAAYNLNGVIDGVNAIFGSPIPLTGVLLLFKNGLMQKKEMDYTVSPDFQNIIFSQYAVPYEGDVITLFT